MTALESGELLQSTLKLAVR